MNRLLTLATRLAAAAQARALDALAIIGLGCLSYGFGQVPVLGAALGPIVLGLGLLAAVRFGTR